MTTVAVRADPPGSDAILPALVPEVLTAADADDLYAAMLRDVCLAVDQSGGDLLVNYRPADQVSSTVAEEAFDSDDAVESALRAEVEPVLSGSGTRFEVQVGATRSARIGNTVTHLLESEGVTSVAAVDPTALFLARPHVDSAAMKLRRSPVVLGPAPGGRLYYAAFAEAIDFTDAFETNPLTTVTGRGRGAGLDVDFVEMLPVLERPGDLATVLPTLEARRRAGLRVPERTAAVLDDLNLDTPAAGE